MLYAPQVLIQQHIPNIVEYWNAQIKIVLSHTHLFDEFVGYIFQKQN